MEVNAIGAIVGLVIAIILILKKQVPAYSLMLGAFIGGLVGGADVPQTVGLMVDGAKNITPAILRILTAGVLAGGLIKSGAAEVIAESIVKVLGEKKALFALALATLILTAVGVFVDVAVITVSPIALVLAKKLDFSKMSILIAMIGGGKSGNIISPNPNTIAASSAFQVNLFDLMKANIIPAIFGLVVATLLAKHLMNKGEKVTEKIEVDNIENKPNFLQAIIGPVVTIFLLALRPIANINIDPLIALPIGGIIACLVMGKGKHIGEYSAYGLTKMTGVAILLLGTGTIAGIITNSTLKEVIATGLNNMGLAPYLLAPISGALMSAATASTTAGTAVASAAFSKIILASGVNALYGASMLHAGATVLDHLPHGSFFHATAGSTGTGLKERLKLIPYESAVGFTLAFVSTLIYGVIL